MKVSAIIRCFNEERHIGRLLAGLARQTRPPDEVVIVDSGSTDSTLDVASHYTDRIIRTAPEEFSFGRSLNVGIRASTGEIILIASAHVYPVYDTWVQHLVEPFGDPEVAVTYGRQVGDDRTNYSESRLLLQWFPPRSIRRQPHAFSNNANAAVRRRAWEASPYDESLTGLEDLAFAREAQAAGLAVSYVAEAPVVHVHEESWDRLVNRYRREAVAYRRITGHGPLSAPSALALFVTNAVTDYVHAARDGVLHRHFGDIPRFRSAQFLGAWRGSHDPDEPLEQIRRRFYYPPNVSTARGEGFPGLGNAIDYGAPPPGSPAVDKPVQWPRGA